MVSTVAIINLIQTAVERKDIVWTLKGAIQYSWLAAQGMRWPFDCAIVRCVLCGRRLWGGERSIAQLMNDKIVALCGQHGGPDGAIMVDVLTGAMMTVPPESPCVVRALHNWGREIHFWLWAIWRFLADLPVLCWEAALYKAQGWYKWQGR
jgi:hypothetical protein